MTDKQPDALRQAAWLKKEGASCQRHYDLGVLIERQHTELETLRAKLKTYEDLGDAGSDVQLLRTGYAAARLEIESLKSQLAEHASHGQAPADAKALAEADRRAACAPAESVLEDAARRTTGQEHAIRQGHEIAASDGYFEARPQIDSNDRRKVFQAGFERGWDAARKQGGKHDNH